MYVHELKQPDYAARTDLHLILQSEWDRGVDAQLPFTLMRPYLSGHVDIQNVQIWSEKNLMPLHSVKIVV
jgi:hypothetical protein